MIGIVDELAVPSQGALKLPNGATRWCVWAPHHQRVALVLWQAGRRAVNPMQCGEEGHFFWEEPAAIDGQRYAYLVGDDPRELPDPASRWQPDGVNKPSAVFDPTPFHWTDASWRGVKPEALVIYELHVGTFTPEGTFDAIIGRLPALIDLGITAIELMPIAQFSGARNWGYDGVHPFAAQNTYGGPQGLQRLVDAAHRAGMAVLLDVVYNHIGPEGNYLGTFGPYFTDRYHTPWGQALNYDGQDSDPVRKLVLDNAAMWIRDFHLDGLRLDAVQTIFDTSALHILAELQQTVQQIADAQNRRVIVIAETNQNDVRLIAPRVQGGYGLDGVWSDDFHHCVHTLLTGEKDGYYSEYGQPEQLAKALREMFVYDGRHSPFHRRRHGNRVGETPREKFVFCVQNHDQVGNRALGDRLASSLSPAQQRLAAALLLLSPAVPLLFMGEEYGETRPFPFFCSFADPRLIEAVRRGRRAELASVRFRWQSEPPDPQAPATYTSAKLTWDWAHDQHRAGLRTLYQDLLWGRRTWPALADRHVSRAEIIRGSQGEACLAFQLGTGGELLVWANLSPQHVDVPGRPREQAAIILSTAAKLYGGNRAELDAIAKLEPYECVVWGPATYPKASLRRDGS
jgi:maltooligosyltrehalose trehalohydrolase